MTSKTDYLEAIKEIGECCKNSVYKSNIVAVYVGGSVARGDFSPGRSDIDIYVIVDGKKEEIESELKKAAGEISNRKLSALMKVHQEPIGITLTALQEIRRGDSFLGAGFEYHNFMKTGKLLWGRDIKPLIPKPTKEEEKASAKQALRQVYALVAEPKNSPPEINERNKDKLTYGFFPIIFRTAAIALCGEGRYVSGKSEVVSVFHEVYPQEELHNLLLQSFKLWKKWETRSLSVEEVQLLMKFCSEFVIKIRALWDTAN